MYIFCRLCLQKKLSQICMVRNLSPLLQCTGRKELLLVNLACFNHADQHLIWFEETSTASNFKIDQVQDDNQLTDDVAQ